MNVSDPCSHNTQYYVAHNTQNSVEYTGSSPIYRQRH